ncbi:uncharacterized protein LOC142624829 [Castanea sativa]|uniref:uncharacterized protein LOC142624829 n=1 Tax=Castanea sativa TaxID=21020 RepID=UPI003F64B153
MVCLVGVNPWKVFVDDASNTVGARAGIVVITLEGIKLEHLFRLGFKASNNKAEYKALLARLRVVSDLGAKEVEITSDSRLTMGYFSSVKVEQVARGQNRYADSLATLASSIANEVPRLIRVELVAESSISVRTGVSQVTTAKKCWMDPIVKFFAEDRIPEDEKKAARVQRNASRYWLSTDRKLYRRSFEGPYLQCLHPSMTDKLLAELHEGVCGSHVGGHSLAHRVMTQGFWWPQMRKDAIEYAWRCEQCQRHALTIHQPVGNLNPKRLEGTKLKWAEELPSDLWAYQTTLRRSTGEIPFSQTFGAEIVIPAEINLCSARVAGFAPTENEELMYGQLNLLEEHHEVATIRLAEYQQKLARRYNKSMRRREFTAGDLVLRKVVGNTRDINARKLAPS